MKLDKVQNVLEQFNIENFSEYNIDKLDLNRAPNPADHGADYRKATDVILLLEDGSRKHLIPGELTRFEADRNDLKAVEVVIYHSDRKEKMLLIN